MQRKYSKQFDIGALDRDDGWKQHVAESHRRLASSVPSGERDHLTCCPICREAESRSFVEIYGFDYQECEACGHIYCATPPKGTVIKALYTSEGQATKTIQSEIYLDEALFATRVGMIATPKVEWVTEVCPAKGLWVDVGCGAGEILAAATQDGWSGCGIEADDEEATFAKQHGVSVIRDFVDDEHCPDVVTEAAVVSLFNVVEHVRGPVEFLKSLARHVRPDGRLVIEVPRHPSLSSLANRSAPDLAARHIYAPDHLHIFTEESLALLLRSCGFEIENVWCFGQDYFEVVTTMMHGRMGYGERFAQQLFARANEVQRAIDEAGLSDSMIVIARRAE